MICSIDIDGVLNNYPTCWLDFIASKTNQQFATIADAKKQLTETEYKAIKEDYRLSGVKGNLPINPSAVEFLKQLKAKDYTILIATSRPFHLYPNLRNLTETWLRKNNFVYDELLTKNDELVKDYPIAFHVDDEPEHAFRFLQKNIPVYFLKRNDIDYTEALQFSTCKIISSFSAIPI